MIHGRFQPFHNGHLEYLRGAAAQSDELFVGITNPDPQRIKEEPSDPQRRTLAERGPSIAAEDHRLVARTRLIGETGDLAGLQCVRERGRTRWHPDASTR